MSVKTKLVLTNILGEKIDVIKEGSSRPKAVNVYVHGYGTDKDEGFASFLDLSKFFSDEYINYRFDLTGYGQSGGKDYEFSFFKATTDVKTVLIKAHSDFPNLPVNIFAHSMGTFVTLLTLPLGVKKIVFTSIVNSNTQFVSKWLEKRILSKGGLVDKNGISIYPRSKGGIQRIGPDFWRVLENFDPVSYLKELARFIPVAIFKPKNDEILPNKYFEAYQNIPNVYYQEIAGDHNFKNPNHRLHLFEKIKKFIERKIP